MGRILGRTILVRLQAIPFGLLMINQQQSTSSLTALQKRASRLLFSYMLLSPFDSQRLFVLFLFPRIPHSETLVAHLWVQMPHRLPTCASQ